MLKEIIENINENDAIYKISHDRDIGKKVAPWVYDAQIMDVLDTTLWGDDVKKEVERAMDSVSFTDQDDLWAIWSTIDPKITDKMLSIMKRKKGIN